MSRPKVTPALAEVLGLAQQWYTSGHVHRVAEHIDQESVDVFATLIRDVDPIHNDPGWAGNSPFGGTIVQGMHMLALVPAQLGTAGLPTRPTAKFVATLRRLERARFVAPLRVGTDACAELAVTKVTEGADSGFEVTVSATLKAVDTNSPHFVGEFVFGYEPPAGTEAPAGIPQARASINADVDFRLPVYEDFHSFFGELRDQAGASLGATDWYTVDDLALGCFGAVTKDFRLDHVPYLDTAPPPGPPRVYPLHHLALSLGMVRDLGLPLVTDSSQTVLNYGFDDVEWSVCADVGRALRTHLRLGGIEERHGGYLVSLVHAVEVERRKDPCMVGTNRALWLPTHELRSALAADANGDRRRGSNVSPSS